MTVIARSGIILAMAIDSSSIRRSALSARLSLISTMSISALAVAFREVALSTLLQAAHGGDHDTHWRR